MRETILIFNLTDKSTRLQIEKALFPLKLRLRYISKENYNQPLGALAGLKELPLSRRALYRRRTSRYHVRFRLFTGRKAQSGSCVTSQKRRRSLSLQSSSDSRQPVLDCSRMLP